jgi:two-component system sensor histidine kinase MtrB
LAISLEDTLLHGGSLDVWARPNQGASFRLTLPKVQGEPVTTSPLPLAVSDVWANSNWTRLSASNR